MSLISLGRVQWHECVVDLLGRSDAIADRDDDGRAVYYLFGWAGMLQYIDGDGKFSEAEASLGSVRMDGFSLFTKAQLDTERVILLDIATSKSEPQRVYARVAASERAARQGKSFDCMIIDKPEFLDDRVVRVSISQVSD